MRKIIGDEKEVVKMAEVGYGEMVCQECGKRGYQRFDNCLASGVHCDDCWSRVVRDSHSKSW